MLNKRAAFTLLILSITFDKSILYAHQINKVVVSISIPKCGTHLVCKCLELLGLKKKVIPEGTLPIIDIPLASFNTGFYLYNSDINHVKYSETYEQKFNNDKIAKFFTIRDPRDQAVSLAFYIKLKPKMYFASSSWNINEILTYLINPSSSDKYKQNDDFLNGVNIQTLYEEFLGWKNAQGFQTIRFENLVGPMGGGSLLRQFDEIRKIANHLGWEIPNDHIQKIAKNLFGNSPTFRQGKIGSWRQHFTQAHIDLWKSNKKLGQLLIDLDYEKSLDW